MRSTLYRKKGSPNVGFVTDICGGLELLHMCHVYALISGFLLLDGATMEKKKNCIGFNELHSWWFLNLKSLIQTIYLGSLEFLDWRFHSGIIVFETIAWISTMCYENRTLPISLLMTSPTREMKGLESRITKKLKTWSNMQNIEMICKL